MATTAYRHSRALDGIRGIFILGFIAYHFGAHVLAGMWVAINFFFVLSAFLITRLLAEERVRRGAIDIAGFYLRRARRLLPALSALLLLVTAYGLVIAPTWQRKALGTDLLATLGYVMNWRLVAEGDQYFFARDVPSPLRHAWTLAIEEQYYLIAPFLILLVFRVARTRRVRVTLLLLAAAALSLWAARVGFHQLADYPRAYYGTDMRGSALLVGSALGVALSARRDGSVPRLPGRWRHVLGWGGLALSVLAFVLVSPFSPWMWNQGGLLVHSLMTAGLVAALADPGASLLTRLLSWRPLVWLGVRTYGLYLWHWPLALLLDFAPVVNRLVSGLLGCVVTIAIAALSYRFLERPVLQRGIRGLLPRTRLPVLWGAAPMVVVALVALVALRPNPSFADLGTATTLPDGRSYDPALETQPRELVTGQAAYRRGEPERIAVFGDSVPHYLAQRFPRLAFPTVHLTALTREGCDLLDLSMSMGEGRDFPNEPLCRELKASFDRQVALDRDEVVVMMASPLLAVPHRLPDGSIGWLDDPRIQELILARWADVRARALAAGVQQVQIVNVPCRQPVPQVIPEEFRDLFERSGHIIAEYRDPQRINALVARFVAEHPDVRLIDLHAVQCGNGFQESMNGIPVFNDFLHFSPQFTPMLWTWLLGQISANWAAR